MNDKTKFLRCSVASGQFSGEYAVSGNTFDGEGFSLFAPKEFVITQSNVEEVGKVDGLVEVEEIDRDGELVLVKLPRQTLENGTTITISASELETNSMRQEA